MKNLKKVLSVLLVVAVLATAMVPAFAAETFTYETQAKALYDIGLFKGTSPTEYVPDLGGDLVREQGIAMIVRLLGKADAAAALTAADQDAALAAFADAKDVEPTLKAAVAYAVKNDLVKGDGKNVDPKGKMPGKDFATILLRNLGYEVTAADYDKACATLVEKGGLTAAEAVKFSEKNLIRDDFVGMSYGALQAAYKDGGTVIAKLVADKVVDADKAEKAGVYKPAALTAKVVGAKKFELAFGTAIDPAKVTASAITVKKGSNTYTVDKVSVAEDKKSAVVTITSTISKGDYEVSVTGIADKALTAKVTAENERVQKIEFPSESAVLQSATDFTKIVVNYRILNQYNEDITTKKYSAVSFTGNKGEQKVEDGKLIYKVGNGATFVMGEKISVTATYLDTDNNNNGQPVFASAVLTVSQMAQVGEIQITELYNDSNSELTVGGNYEDYYLLVDAKDQYGSKVPVDNLGSAVVVQTTDPTITRFDTKTIDNVETPVFKEITINGVKHTGIALKAPDTNVTARAGKADIIIVSKANGKSAKYTVTVKDTQKIDTLSLQMPEFAVAGEVIKIPFTAVDVNGTEITKLSGLKMNADKSELSVSGVTGVSVAKFEMDPVSNKPVLTLDARPVSGKATVYISGLTATYKPVNMTITLQDRPKLETLAGIKSDYKTNILFGNTVAFNFDKVLVQDSYGRNVSKDDLVVPAKYDFGTKYRYTVESSNPDKIELQSVGGKTYYQELGAGEINFFAREKGTSTITVTLQQYDGVKDGVTLWKDITDTSFSVTTVEAKSIESYKVATVDAVYTKVDALKTGLYTADVKVTGVLANGKEVEIPKTTFRVNTSANLSYNDGKIFASPNTNLASDKEEEATFVVSVLGEKPGTISSKTKISGKPPVSTTLSLVSTGDGRKTEYAGEISYVKEADTVVSIDRVVGLTDTKTNVEALTKKIVKVVDQYGKTIPNTLTGDEAFIRSVSIDSVKDASGNYVSTTAPEYTAYAKGFSLYVTAVTKDGAVFSFTLAINN